MSGPINFLRDYIECEISLLQALSERCENDGNGDEAADYRWSIKELQAALREIEALTRAATPAEQTTEETK